MKSRTRAEALKWELIAQNLMAPITLNSNEYILVKWSDSGMGAVRQFNSEKWLITLWRLFCAEAICQALNDLFGARFTASPNNKEVREQTRNDPVIRQLLRQLLYSFVIFHCTSSGHQEENLSFTTAIKRLWGRLRR